MFGYIYDKRRFDPDKIIDALEDLDLFDYVACRTLRLYTTPSLAKHLDEAKNYAGGILKGMTIPLFYIYRRDGEILVRSRTPFREPENSCLGKMYSAMSDEDKQRFLKVSDVVFGLVEGDKWLI